MVPCQHAGFNSCQTSGCNTRQFLQFVATQKYSQLKNVFFDVCLSVFPHSQSPIGFIPSWWWQTHTCCDSRTSHARWARPMAVTVFKTIISFNKGIFVAIGILLLWLDLTIRCTSGASAYTLCHSRSLQLRKFLTICNSAATAAW